MGSGRSKRLLVVKSIWLSANFTIWLLGLGSCLSDPTCSVARDNLLAPSFLLSFPGSLLFLIVNEIFIESGVFIGALPATHYTYLSLAILTVGYFQWFHLIPALFGKCKITTLALHHPEPLKLAQPASRSLAQPGASQVRAFDRAGRSPLERAIKQESPRRFTNAS